MPLFVLAGRLVQIGDCLLDLLLSPPGFGNDPHDAAAMSGDRDGFSALDFVEELSEACFGLRGRNFSHRRSLGGIDQFNWSKCSCVRSVQDRPIPRREANSLICTAAWASSAVRSQSALAYAFRWPKIP